MIRHSNRYFCALCRVVVLALLFAQAAYAAQPCVTPGMSAAGAMSGQMGDDCDMPAEHAGNLCVINCTDNDKLSASPPLLVPPLLPTEAILVLPPLRDNTPAAVAMCSLIEPVRDPPKAIRFCSFLI